jgi:hypothetical protein
VVSAHASPSERKPAFFAVIAASVFNRSRVDRASRSSRVTITTSPVSSWSSRRQSCRPVGLKEGSMGSRILEGLVKN